MSPKTITEAIEQLQHLERNRDVWNHHMFNMHMDNLYQFLLKQVQKFVNAAVKANFDSNYNYSVAINNCKCLEFRIYDTDCLTILYAGHIGEHKHPEPFWSFGRQSFTRYEGIYSDYSCTQMIRFLKAIEGFYTALNKHLKADAKLQKKPVLPLHSTAHDAPW